MTRMYSIWDEDVMREWNAVVHKAFPTTGHATAEIVEDGTEAEEQSDAADLEAAEALTREREFAGEIDDDDDEVAAAEPTALERAEATYDGPLEV